MITREVHSQGVAIATIKMYRGLGHIQLAAESSIGHLFWASSINERFVSCLLSIVDH